MYTVCALQPSWPAGVEVRREGRAFKTLLYSSRLLGSLVAAVSQGANGAPSAAPRERFSLRSAQGAH